MSDQGSNGRPSWGTILTLTAIVGGLGTIIRPLQQTQENLQKQLNKTIDWQEDYAKGRIPSSAEKELAAIREHFAEIETQFKGFKEQMIASDRFTNDGVMRNSIAIQSIQDRLATLREQIAVLQVKHERTLP